MPRESPAPSVSNLRSAAQAVRAAISGMSGAVADAFTALAGGLDQAQSAIETLEGKNRELAAPDVLDPRSRSTAYVSGDRIIGGIQVQGGLATNAGQGLDLAFEAQTATIASKDHKDNTLLPLVIQGATISFTGTVSFGTVIPVSSGGTGLATLTAHALYVGNGTSAPTALGLGTTATLLHGNAAGDPTWGAVALASDVSGTLPVANGGTGTATGSITGTGDLTFTAGGSNKTVTLVSSGTGKVAAKPGTDSATAIQLQNAAGSPVVNVDTSNGFMGVGTTAPTAPVHVKAANGYYVKLDATSPAQVYGVGIAGADGSLLLDDITGGARRLTVTTTGKFGIAVSSPTAMLHLPACAAAANTAPLKIDPGTVATTPVSGNIESDGTHLYWTDSGGTRKQLD